MTRAVRGVILALLALYPAVIVLLATRPGVGISQDSVSYLATARSVASGMGLTTFTGEPLTLFPPGFPILLGAGEAVGVDALTAGRLIGLGAVVLVVVGTYLLAGYAHLGPWSRIVATAAVSLSAAFLGVFAWLWTEPVFTVLVLAVLVVLVRAITRGEFPWWAVALVGVLASLATTVRYAGLVLVPVVALGSWLATRSLPTPTRAVRAAVVVALALVTPVLLAARNLSLGAGPLGERFPGSRTLQGAVDQMVEILGGFLLPAESTELTGVAGAALLVLLAIGVWLSVVRRDRAVQLLGAFIVVYGAVMVWSQGATRLDAPSARLLAPALPAIAVIAVFAGRAVLTAMLDQATRWAAASPSSAVRAHGSQAVRVVLGAAVAVLLVTPVIAALLAGQRLARDGADGSLTDAAAASPLVSSVIGLAGSSGIASNDPWVVYLGAGRPSVLPLPPSLGEWPVERVEADAQALATAVGDGRVAYAAVFRDGPAIESLDSLAAYGVRAEAVAETADGTVYRLSPAP